MTQIKISWASIESFYIDKLSKEFPNLSRKQVKNLISEVMLRCTVKNEIIDSAHFIVEEQPELLG